MTRSRRSGGFTLVELMVVVVTIGVLASVALPAYQDYTIRTRFAEAFSLGDVARRGVTEYYGRWGRMPKDNAAAGLLPPASYRGRHVRSVEVRDGVVRIVVTPHGADNTKSYSLYLRPLQAGDAVGGSMAWTCSPAAPAGFQVIGALGPDVPPSRYLPGSCR